MFQIFEIAPIYHFSTDAIIGEKVVWRSHAYMTAALALKIATIKDQASYDDGSDNTFVVAPFDGSPFTQRIVASLLPDEDGFIPF